MPWSTPGPRAALKPKHRDLAYAPAAMDLWLLFPLLMAAGCVAGSLNVVAGGGSFITLPVLIFLGLPAGVANGTNRVGILLQNIAAVWSFERHGVLERRALVWGALPSVPGGALGAWLALALSDAAFQRILAFLMVALALATLRSPADVVTAKVAPGPLLAIGFFLVGAYAGFVQAGVGFLFLVLTTVAGLDLVRGNGVKVLSILCLTVLALGIFAWQGRVDWGYGVVLGAGQLVGGVLGARLTVLKGHAWVRRVVLVTVVAFAVKLWLDA